MPFEDAYERSMNIGAYGSLLGHSDLFGIPTSVQVQILFKILEIAGVKKLDGNELEQISKFYTNKRTDSISIEELRQMTNPQLHRFIKSIRSGK
jgi:hypothetical protein